MPLKNKKGRNQSMGLMALAGETAKMALNMMVLEKTEAALEKEMEKADKRIKPTTRIGKIRGKGGHIIHGKYVLLMVVVLNVIDCLLVLGELMLDIKYVTDLLTKEYERSEEFIGSMKGLYPARLGYLGVDDIESLEHEIITASLTWDTTGHGTGHDVTTARQLGNDSHTTDRPTESHNTTVVHSTLSTGHSDNNVRKRRASTSNDHDTGINSTDHGTDEDHEEHAAHSIEEDIAHALHKASISILGILVCENMIKIFCVGKEMFEHKLECFDCFVVVVSFIVDIILIKGIQQFTVQEFVLILAFMVPWRIIRVVNSLVVAIMDHEHFRLVLLYKQKKKISTELKKSTSENKGLEACISALEKLCTEAGIPDTQISAKLNMYRKVKAKTNAMGALSSFAVGGDAMNKPFQNGNVQTTKVSTEDETNYKKVQQLKHVLSPEPVVTELVHETAGISGSIPIKHDHFVRDQRQRSSQSAIEPSQATHKDSELLQMLAENSASFIATINKDDVDLSMRVPTMLKHQETTETEEKDKAATVDISDSLTAESYTDKSQGDEDDLVKDYGEDDNKVEGHDNPVSRL